MNSNLLKKIKKVRIFVTDVDGVLTDGRVFMDAGGNEYKMFNVLDGAAMKYAQTAGFKTIFISGRKSVSVQLRAKEIGVERVFQGVKDKKAVLNKIIKEEKCDLDALSFIGDDLPDIPVINRVGFSAAVKNAAYEVKKRADYVTKKGGGEGAFREVVELVLKAQNHWGSIIKRFDV